MKDFKYYNRIGVVHFGNSALDNFKQIMPINV